MVGSTIQLDNGYYGIEIDISYESASFVDDKEINFSYMYCGVEFTGTFTARRVRPELIGIFDGITGNDISYQNELGYNISFAGNEWISIDFVYNVTPESVVMDRGYGIFDDCFYAELLGYDAERGGYVARFTLYESDLDRDSVYKLSVKMNDSNYSNNYIDDWDCYNVCVVETNPQPPRSLGINLNGYDLNGYSVEIAPGSLQEIYVMVEGVTDDMAASAMLTFYVDGFEAFSIMSDGLYSMGGGCALTFTWCAEIPPQHLESGYIPYKATASVDGKILERVDKSGYAIPDVFVINVYL
jgi:hypothetical protein